VYRLHGWPPLASLSPGQQPYTLPAGRPAGPHHYHVIVITAAAAAGQQWPAIAAAAAAATVWA